MRFRKPYDRESSAALRASTALQQEGPDKTHQSFKADADLNEIIRRMGAANEPIPIPFQQVNGDADFSELPDLRTALDRVRDAREKFDSLPAKLRKRFNNSPSRLWEFVQDPENQAEALELGLLVRSPVTAPPSAPAAPSAPPDMPAVPAPAQPG